MAQITVSELAVILDADARTTRRFLRSITPKENCPGKGARWAIEKREVRAMTKKFAAFSAAELAKKNARDEAKNAPIENENENEIADPTDDEILAESDDEN